MREIEFRAVCNGIEHEVTTNVEIRKDKNGWYKNNGYVLRKVKNHPYADKRGYVQEHRLIVEQQIGRFLIPKIELVHHINGKRDDNRIENLLLSNPKDHAKGHVGQRNANGGFVCISKEFDSEKYRLFDKDRNITRIYTLNELISKTFRRGKFEYRGKFTGLKDKNDVEIYEGDVVKWDVNGTSVIAPVYYEESCASFWMGKRNGTGSLVLNDWFRGEYEVIGNIHEQEA